MTSAQNSGNEGWQHKITDSSALIQVYYTTKKRRDLHRLTENNCQVSPYRVVRRRIHEFPSAYDQTTQCWAYTQCTRTQTRWLSNQQTPSPSYHERDPARCVLDTFQLTCCFQLTRFCIGHIRQRTLRWNIGRDTCVRMTKQTQGSARATAETQNARTQERHHERCIIVIHNKIDLNREYCISMHLRMDNNREGNSVSRYNS